MVQSRKDGLRNARTRFWDATSGHVAEVVSCSLPRRDADRALGNKHNFQQRDALLGDIPYQGRVKQQTARAIVCNLALPKRSAYSTASPASTSSKSSACFCPGSGHVWIPGMAGISRLRCVAYQCRSSADCSLGGSSFDKLVYPAK